MVKSLVAMNNGTWLFFYIAQCIAYTRMYCMLQVYQTYYRFLLKYRIKFAIFSILILVWGIIEGILPYFFKLFVDAIPQADYQIVLLILLVYVFLQVTELILDVITIFVGDSFLIPAARDARVAVVKKIQDLDFAFHLTKSTGSLISAIKRGDQAFFSLHHIINVQMTRILINFSIMLFVFFTFDWRIVIIMSVVVVWNLFLALFLIQHNIRTRSDFNRVEDDISAVIVDNLINYETVKLFAKEKQELFHLKTVFVTWLQKLWRFANSFRLIDIVIGSIGNGGIFLVLWLGLRLLQTGQLTAGEYIAMISFIGMFYFRFFDLVYELRNMAKFYTDLSKYFAWLPLETKVKDPVKPVTIHSVKGEVIFDAVSFSYPEGKQEALKDINLRVRAGQSVAFVGHSGAGKTSITKLLLRFYDPEQGRILLDGIDITQLKKSHLRSFIGVVPQEPIMFNNTIRFNIAYGADDPEERAITAATKMANLHDFILSLPEGYETNVGERGVKLSGGQKQRLAIARMILSDPEIIIFDEATSQLDSESERLIQDAFWKAAKGKTTFIIAHRLSSITKAEKIVVMEDGQIKEVGSHRHLLNNKNSLYKKFWDLQTQAHSESGSNQ